MPTYGYRCENGHEFDLVQRMSDEPVAECPSCGSRGRRLFFPAGIVFKGSGFYKTDSRKSGGSDSSSSSGSSSSASKSSSDGGSGASTATAAGAAGD
ncbi:MAG TPA: FmdB family zinc ribbon protein [Candidatus Dormibacteraeota bacterium]|nr:FmdB family zinc ribbon protein [Candidatus Dormibacteraeota bacterium]